MESGANILFVPRSRSVGQVVMGPVNSKWLHGIRGEYFVCTKVAHCFQVVMGPVNSKWLPGIRGEYFFVPRSRSVGQVVRGPVNSKWLHRIRGEYFVCTKVAQCWSGCYGPCELEMTSWNQGRIFCLYQGRAVLVRLLWAL